MQRVSVMGSSGSGKTTFAARLAARLDVPHVELDAIHHLPGWEPIQRVAFREEVARRCADDGWVVDGNYSAVRDLVWQAADTVVFLDLPRPRVMAQVIRRSARRVVTRQELWNGNRERLADLLSSDERRNIVIWTWTQHGKYRARYLAGIADPDLAHLHWVRLRSHGEAHAFLDVVGS